MLTTLMVGIFSGIISFVVINLIPLWVILSMAVLAVLFIFPPIMKIRRGDSSMAIQGALQKPLERAAAVALLLQYILPWLDQVFNLGLF
jgi:hypothetical protein